MSTARIGILAVLLGIIGGAAAFFVIINLESPVEEAIVADAESTPRPMTRPNSDCPLPEPEPEPDRPLLDPHAKVGIILSDQQQNGLPESVQVTIGAQTRETQLTGSFVRIRKLLIVPLEIYTIASYVESPTRGTTSELLDKLAEDGQTKVLYLKFIRNLSGRQIMNAIRDEIAMFQGVDMVRLRPSIDRFCSQFAQGARTGESVCIVWLPGGRMLSAYNRTHDLEEIANDVPFSRAIWRIWSGPTAGKERFRLVARFADPIKSN